MLGSSEIMGIGALILIAVFAGSVCLSVLKQQALAGWVTGCGVLLLTYFGMSVVFGDSYQILALPYRVVNIYLFLFLAVIFTVAGSIGLSVRLIRHFRHD